MITGEQGDDPVRFTQLLGAQHDSLVAVQAHSPIVPDSGVNTGAHAGFQPQLSVRSP
jgi:hypothetical protein